MLLQKLVSYKIPQAYSYGGTTGQVEPAEIVSNMKAIKTRPIKIRFNADVASSMQWNFKPQQHDITVCITHLMSHPLHVTPFTKMKIFREIATWYSYFH